ncbi:MAG: MFS transporter, partial [Limnochordales bacterium]
CRIVQKEGGYLMSRAAAAAAGGEKFVGNDKVLFGIIFGVLAFWLFAQTTLNIAPGMAEDLGIETNVMNIAVFITALFSGIFIVVMGGLADRLGRVRVLNWGFMFSIAGSLLVGLAPKGGLGTVFLMLGRILQGLSVAAIMSSSLALVQVYREGAARQRAISLWSMGSWGGSGFAALFGGLMMQNVGWRWIFFGSAALSLIGMLMVKGTPESKAEGQSSAKFDLPGVITFMIMMVALQVFATQGGALGWTSPASLALLAVSVVFGVLFYRIESRADNAFVNFKLFKNSIFTGATISNLLLNGTAGMLIVAMSLVQLGGNMSAQEAGLLTLGYAIIFVAFIRVGEKLLQRFGPRKPMIWGSLIVGLAFYATPSTDAALSSLPRSEAGSGSGIYKMASSLGASFGVAISAAVFTAISGDASSVQWIEGVISFIGRQDNLAVRQAGFFALTVNWLMVAGAIVSIMLTIPKQTAPAPAPAPRVQKQGA